MKKIIGLFTLTLLMFACQKEDIRPNAAPKPIEVQKNGSSDNDSNSGGIISTTPSPSTNPGSVDPDGGSITDPLRKKDKKD